MNPKPKGIAQPAISEVLAAFLEEQRQRLKPRTFRRYEDVVQLLQLYINDYGPGEIDEREEVRYDGFHRQGLEFCDIYGPEEILSRMGMFLSYFMVRKVVAGQDLLRAAGTVTKNLARWLQEKGYATAQGADRAVAQGTRAACDLPKAERLSDLLYDFAHSAPPEEILEQLDDHFTIERVEPGRLWLAGLMYHRAETVGPISVPKQVTDLAEEGWAVSLLLGRTRRGWRILEVGNVYPL